jgi:N-acetylglucosamine kinase-like BadF-type ATPase
MTIWPAAPAPEAEPALALGLDVGGTSTRALLADLTGRRLGAGRAGGANMTAHSARDALDAIGTAVRGALAGQDPGRVVALVLATAGIRNLARPEVSRGLAQVWHDAGVRCPVRIVPDSVAAFAAGSAEPAGTLVLSGTGALAAKIVDRDVARVVDGYGWLLGDVGSGFWLGREAVRATLRALDEDRSPGPLGRAVLDALLAGSDAPTGHPVAVELVLAVHQRPPVALAELAPVVCGLADDDGDAGRIVADAAEHLTAAARAVRGENDASPLVLAGSLLVTDTAVAAAVRARIEAVWPAAPVHLARDGAAGAAWLAVREALDADGGRAAAVHATLVGRR